MQDDLSLAPIDWEESQNDCAFLSEAALAVDWLRPEEEEAWRYLAGAGKDPSSPDTP